MKQYNLRHSLPSALFLLSALAVGCSSSPFTSSKSSQDLAQRGPTILDARSNPDTIQLNRDLTPASSSEIVADIKDFTSPVSSVRLRFLHVPIELPMKNVQGTTWTADLSAAQLKRLAVGGQTMKYDATIIAKDKAGLETASSSPLTIAIKTPDLTKSG